METRVVPVELLEEVEDALKTAAFDTVRSGEAKELMALADKLNEIHVRAHADRRAAQVKAAATQDELNIPKTPSFPQSAAPCNHCWVKEKDGPTQCCLCGEYAAPTPTSELPDAGSKLPLSAIQISMFNRAALCIPDIQDKLCDQAIAAIELNTKLGLCSAANAHYKMLAEKAEATLALTIEGAGNHMVRAERAEDKLEKAERENADLRHDIQRSVQRNSELLAECYELKAKLARYEAAERESPEEPQHYIPVHFGNSAMIPCGKGGWIDSQDYDALRTYAIAWKVENDRTQQGLINYAREIVGLETALSSARAHQRELEPAAWIEHHKGGANLNWERVDNPYAKATPLYRARKDAP